MINLENLKELNKIIFDLQEILNKITPKCLISDLSKILLTEYKNKMEDYWENYSNIEVNSDVYISGSMEWANDLIVKYIINKVQT